MRHVEVTTRFPQSFKIRRAGPAFQRPATRTSGCLLADRYFPKKPGCPAAATLPWPSPTANRAACPCAAEAFGGRREAPAGRPRQQHPVGRSVPGVRRRRSPPAGPDRAGGGERSGGGPALWLAAALCGRHVVRAGRRRPGRGAVPAGECSARVRAGGGKGLPGVSLHPLLSPSAAAAASMAAALLLPLAAAGATAPRAAQARGLRLSRWRVRPGPARGSQRSRQLLWGAGLFAPCGSVRESEKRSAGGGAPRHLPLRRPTSGLCLPGAARRSAGLPCRLPRLGSGPAAG